MKGGTARCISRVYIFSYLPLGDRGPNDKQVRCRYIDIDVQITRWSVGNPHTMEKAVPVLEMC